MPTPSAGTFRASRARARPRTASRRDARDPDGASGNGRGGGIRARTRLRHHHDAETSHDRTEGADRRNQHFSIGGDEKRHQHSTATSKLRPIHLPPRSNSITSRALPPPPRASRSSTPPRATPRDTPSPRTFCFAFGALAPPSPRRPLRGDPDVHDRLRGLIRAPSPPAPPTIATCHWSDLLSRSSASTVARGLEAADSAAASFLAAAARLLPPAVPVPVGGTGTGGGTFAFAFAFAFGGVRATFRARGLFPGVREGGFRVGERGFRRRRADLRTPRLGGGVLGGVASRRREVLPRGVLRGGGGGGAAKRRDGFARRLRARARRRRLRLRRRRRAPPPPPPRVSPRPSPPADAPPRDATSPSPDRRSRARARAGSNRRGRRRARAWWRAVPRGGTSRARRARL